MPHRQVVLDLETQKIFDEIGTRNPGDLGVSVAGVYFYENDEYACYEETRLPELELRLSKASRVIGFNIRRFDFPVLQPYLKHIDLGQMPLLDIMDDLEKTLGHRVSLQSVASATLGVGKSGSGLDAIHYYRSGEMEKLKKYCLDDVRLTKDVYEFGKKNGLVYYLSKDGSNRLTARVNWKDPAPPVNLSLF
ncbi:MAG TPA: ribonuclease H-like domain-containing protein [bacterium]|nr:ribonuclease H-like domain-containing protein [bacterium]